MYCSLLDGKLNIQLIQYVKITTVLYKTKSDITIAFAPSLESCQWLLLKVDLNTIILAISALILTKYKWSKR